MTSTPLLSNRAILEYLYFRSFPQELGRFLLNPRKAMKQCLTVGLISVPSSNHSTQKGGRMWLVLLKIVFALRIFGGFLRVPTSNSNTNRGSLGILKMGF